MCAHEQIGRRPLFKVHPGSTLKRGHTMKYSILLAAITALSLSACNKTENTVPATDTTAPATAPAVTEPAAPAAAPADTVTPPPADTTTPPADSTAPAGTAPAGTTPPAGGATTQ
jgi:hypothetical protein